ncbi:MAG TPA: efflux RND transporter periplasmic adaptor subunit [Candidatus Obscuribacterales bacterium]
MDVEASTADREESTLERKTTACDARTVHAMVPGKRAHAISIKKGTTIAAVAVFALLVAWSSLWLSHKQSGGETRAAAPQAVATVAVEKLTEHVLASQVVVSGSVWAWDPLTIGAEVNGLRIESVHVEEGDLVKKGQVLARLNSSVLQAQLAQEKARLKAGLANLKKAIQPNRPEDLTSIRAALSHSQASVAEEEANLLKARANHANALSNAARYRGLAREGAVSAQEAETKETQAITAEAEVRNAEQRVRAAKFMVEQAKQRLAMAEKGGRQEDVDISAASVEETRANVRRLEAMLEQTIIRAPSNGLIMRRDAHLGDITSAGKSLFLIARDNRLELRAQIPEVDMPKVKPGQRVACSEAAQPGVALFGKVREISPMVDQDFRLGTVKIDLPSDGEGCRLYKPGNFVHARIDLGSRSVLALPAEAVLTANKTAHVFVVNADNTVAARTVETGTRQDGLVEIVSGLRRGDDVVVKGAGFLKDGDVVRVKRSTGGAHSAES